MDIQSLPNLVSIWTLSGLDTVLVLVVAILTTTLATRLLCRRDDTAAPPLTYAAASLISRLDLSSFLLVCEPTDVCRARLYLATLEALAWACCYASLRSVWSDGPKQLPFPPAKRHKEGRKVVRHRVWWIISLLQQEEKPNLFTLCANLASHAH